MNFEPQCLATTIGSLPLDDAREATELILTYTPQIPSWVQLAKRPQEGMLVQFNEGLPGLTRSDQKVYFDTEAPGFQDEILHFYERYLAATETQPSTAIEAFALTPSYAEGFHLFIEALNQSECHPIALKGQVTGPFTLATSLTDQAGKSSFYNSQLRDCIVKMISLKAQWQIKKLHPFGVPVIISIDEPSLVGFVYKKTLMRSSLISTVIMVLLPSTVVRILTGPCSLLPTLTYSVSMPTAILIKSFCTLNH
jgi:hypothetical protein